MLSLGASNMPSLGSCQMLQERTPSIAQGSDIPETTSFYVFCPPPAR